VPTPPVVDDCVEDKGVAAVVQTVRAIAHLVSCLGSADVEFRGRGDCRARQSTASALFSDYYFVDDHTVQEILCNSSDPYEL
jgi:hypothetical protein